MLSRAGAVLRARPANRQAIARKPSPTLSRNYAPGISTGGKKTRDNLNLREDDNKNKHLPLTRDLVRKVTSKDDEGPLFPGHTQDAQPAAVGARTSNAKQDESQQQQQQTQPKQPKTKWATERLKGTTAFGIVTTSQPSGTALQELILEIRRYKAGIPFVEGHSTNIVLLFTPAFAQYALDEHVPKAVFERLRIQYKPGSKFHITSAVVDRLPNGSQEIEGAEGMAYMLFRNAHAVNMGEQVLFQDSTQKPGSLTFQMPRVVTSTNKTVWQDYEVQLPLSQTVFSTGLVSTMISREYITQSQKLELLGSKKLESQTLRFPVLPEESSKQIVHMPLVPLTPFRKINYVMGNIIRKLSAQRTWDLKSAEGNDSELIEQTQSTAEDMPASQELEEAVSSYFDALGLQPETVSVWALVIPRTADLPRKGRELHRLGHQNLLTADNKVLAAAWDPKNQAASSMSNEISLVLRRLIAGGARLIKVLSGGGGWGKKAGLLSLDPDVEYSTRELRKDDGWQFNFDNFDDGTEAAAEAQRSQALGQIVKEGESIMFLLAPKQENLPRSAVQVLQQVHESSPHLHDKPKSLDLSFGTIPSSIDVVPQRSSADPAVSKIQHFPGHFGMLSEGGMAVNIRTKGKSKQTKLDVPHGRYYFQQYVDFHYPDARTFGPALTSGGGDASVSEVDRTLVNDAAKLVGSTKSQKKKGRKDKKALAQGEPEQKRTSDLFEQFAEYDESDFTSPASQHKPESHQNGNPL